MNAQTLDTPKCWRWRMRPEDLPDDPLPSQLEQGRVSALLVPCIVTVSPSEAKRRALAGGHVPEVKGYCSVDTGSPVSAIAIAVMRELNIDPVDHITSFGCSSPHPMRAPIFPATLIFPPGSNLPDLALRDFIGVTQPTVDETGKRVIALLGRAALSRFVMVYDGLAGSITLMER